MTWSGFQLLLKFRNILLNLLLAVKKYLQIWSVKKRNTWIVTWTYIFRDSGFVGSSPIIDIQFLIRMFRFFLKNAPLSEFKTIPDFRIPKLRILTNSEFVRSLPIGVHSGLFRSNCFDFLIVNSWVSTFNFVSAENLNRFDFSRTNPDLNF